MIKPRVINGVTYAAGRLEAIPTGATGRDAVTARVAALRLASIVYFSRSRNATMRGNPRKGASLAENGLRFDAIAADLERRGAFR